jgi:hypothetical protein
MLGPAIGLPTACWSGDAALCGHDDLVTVTLPGLQGSCYEPLVVPDILVVEAVDIRGVDKSDAGIQCGVNNSNRLRLRRTILYGKVHPTIPHCGDGRGIEAEAAAGDHDGKDGHSTLTRGPAAG